MSKYSNPIVLLAILAPISGCNRVSEYSRQQEYNQMNVCSQNLRQIGLSIRMYQMDNSEKLPPISSGPTAYGWADVLNPYGVKSELLQCPSEPNPPAQVPSQSGYSDYWLNKNLASAHHKAIKQPGMTLLMGEGNDGTDVADARYAKSQLPRNWYNSSNSPFARHRSGSNFLYADTHVKWGQNGKLLKMVSQDGQPVAKFSVR